MYVYRFLFYTCDFNLHKTAQVEITFWFFSKPIPGGHVIIYQIWGKCSTHCRAVIWRNCDYISQYLCNPRYFDICYSPISLLLAIFDRNLYQSRSTHFVQICAMHASMGQGHFKWYCHAIYLWAKRSIQLLFQNCHII